MPSSIGLRGYLAGSAALFVVLGAGAALAQEAVPSATALEEVVVTAQRREENVQRTAVAITAVGGEEIARRAATSLDTVLSTTPSVQIQGNAGGGQVYIRGVGSNNDAVYGNPAVNLNLDGVYQQQPTAVTGAMYDVARVEVLRGPQGTLYGRNATGGSINVITNDPTEEFAGAGAVQIGNYSQKRVEGMVNAPVSDTLAVRAAFASERRDGYLSNGDSDADSLAARLKVLYRPSDDVRLLLGGSYIDERGAPAGSVAAPLSSHADDPWYNNYLKGVHTMTQWTTYGQLDVSTPIGELTILPAHLESHRFDNRQLLGNVTSFAYGEFQNSLEARLASRPGAAVTWVAGLYVLKSDQARDQGKNYIGGTLQGAERVQSTTLTKAAFGQMTVPLGERLRLTGGARITSDEKQQTYAAGPEYETSKDTFTYKAGAEYDLAEQVMVYGNLSTAFKAGGFGEDPAASQYDPEKLTAYQLGLKSRFLENRLQLNLEAFYYDYSDYQVVFPLIIGGVFYNITRNAGEATVKGLEAELTAKLSRADTLRVGVSRLDGQFGTFAYTDVSGPRDFSGFTMPNTPKWSGDVAFEHRFDLPSGGDITASVNVHFSSRYQTTVERTTDAEQGAYTRSDLALAYSPAEGKWTLRAFVKNIEDEPVRIMGLATPVASRLMIGPPRTYGAAFSVKF